MDNGAQEALRKMVRALGKQVKGLSADAAMVFLAIGEEKENGYSLSKSLKFAQVRIDLAFNELTNSGLVEVFDTDMVPQMIALTPKGLTIRAVAAKSA